MGPVAAYMDWVPEESVLHFRNYHNGHNESWLRADGYVSRPFILAGARFRWRDFWLIAGGFMGDEEEP